MEIPVGDSSAIGRAIGSPVWTAVEKPIYSQAVCQSPDMMTRHTSTSLLIMMAVSYFDEQRTEKS